MIEAMNAVIDAYTTILYLLTTILLVSLNK